MTIDENVRTVPDRGRLRWFLIGSVALISFSAFESLAVGTVLPRAAEQFGATAEYSVAFGAAFAAMIVAIAWVGPWVDRSGVRPPLIAGALLFAAGLLIVGSAPGMTVLAVGRGVQGLGSGLISVVLYAMVGRLIPPAGRPRVFAAYSTAWVVPSLVGPAIAGLAAGTVGWRWVFLGLAAPSLLALFATLRATTGLDESAYRNDDPPNRGVLFAALAAGTAAAVAQFAAPQGGSGFLLLAAAAFVIAVIAARRMLPAGSLIGRPGIPRLMLANLLMAGSFFAAEIYVPLYLVHIDRLSPFAAGSVMTGAALLWALASQLQARIPPDGALRERLPLIGSSLLTLALVAVATSFAVDAPWPVIFATWAIGGFGMGLTYPTLSILMLGRSADDEQGTNSSALKLSDAVGTALAIACTGALFAQVLAWGNSGFAVTLLVPLASGLATVAVTSRLTAE
ncbi:Major facilitator superfamily MFS_1 OS=Tsukamurella paurometabola (strain ATCC 8368 / DSM /CCUG 35730 / CIP 100753 / JCM 10117 / KCTC 9821 / NBRC 16120/ NCIMB 702349 / NCTC 13040) OX=521096 GN=Tpau_0209 PE=4 SV=1 [Tsukamurella paurometabola]|uniref:Major facilitator superfamily MFS_1 n=1 Tax=Tsukamurella paurometabola (strain ATCC 8368 / DSM 20162 / CCUG 35730 / CIP 100753 / JCM 10117 / KCTC 9821 / NBRC 16120 / NCIMB 702349 / NCTC 13040) TaxID=521096 RepID=D5UQN0_TSUPD|nr:MFS transporter [Tsukamurella paurometabola]ADG76863.1 major facilitator superfamily MFS_1 [Tsukamurella paurometabola DSM 20162]SUP41967.1 Probable multidrug-efflux transporter Rv1634/MT1670 [Tsukamurella paurometabola]